MNTRGQEYSAFNKNCILDHLSQKTADKSSPVPVTYKECNFIYKSV